MEETHTTVRGFNHLALSCGCRAAPCCFECPLEQCIFDAPHALRTRSAAAEARDLKIQRARDNGTSRHSLANLYTVSLGTIDRALRRRT